LYVHKNALSYVVNLDFASKGRKRDFFLNFIYYTGIYRESQAHNSAVLEVGGAEVIVCNEGKVSGDLWQEYFYYCQWKN
jgi:hypothetical protein